MPEPQQAPAQPPDFFISYSGVDRAWAEWIAWALEAAGYRTLLQAWDFRPGTNFVQAMQQAAAEADRTLAVLSPDYLTLAYAQPEWQAAFAQDPTSAQAKLLPVRVRGCTPTGLLAAIVYIDLVGQDEAAAQAALLSGVTTGRAKPHAPPGFPGDATAAEAGRLARPRFPGQAGGPAGQRLESRLPCFPPLVWNKALGWGVVVVLMGLLVAIATFIYGSSSDRSVKAKGDIKIENGIIQTGDGTINTSKPESKP